MPIDPLKTGTVYKKEGTKSTQNVSNDASSIEIPIADKKTAQDKKAQERARKYYDEYIENGKLKYIPEVNLLGLNVKDAYYIYTPDRHESFANLKGKLNLPDGTFADQLKGFPGNKDLYKVEHPVTIDAKILHEAIGE